MGWSDVLFHLFPPYLWIFDVEMVGGIGKWEGMPWLLCYRYRRRRKVFGWLLYLVVGQTIGFVEAESMYDYICVLTTIHDLLLL